ncbi:ATP-binding protein [Psychrobacter frigidicola]|uniref:ATP-binding protein n=1 Tax=Psychrobacter frigidicola TaxID=45611 RepID=A0A5C7A736_9GAMM|nr:ATP-binding protein [Psychrobacter frigidicola]TXD98344.1 ATP-binding protein [Psychrobacter frigidicola]
MQLIIFIGIQGAGKSTFYQRQFFHSHIRLNKDMLNTNHRLQLLFEACLTSKTKTVIDKTNPTVLERADFITAAKAANFEVIAYYLDCPFKDALARNNARQGKEKIPEVGVKGTAKKMQRPRFEEGFDRIFIVSVGEDTFSINEYLDSAPP